MGLLGCDYQERLFFKTFLLAKTKCFTPNAGLIQVIGADAQSTGLATEPDKILPLYSNNKSTTESTVVQGTQVSTDVLWDWRKEKRFSK